jgi:hypothetical protein
MPDMPGIGSRVFTVKMKNYFFPVLFCLLLLPAVSSGLMVPERLEYDLTLADIKVGSMSLEAAGKAPYVQLESKANAVSWVSLFYGLEDHVVSLLEKGRREELPETFSYVTVSSKVRIREGPNRAQKEFAFDYAKQIITYSDELKHEKASLPLKDLTFDALSALYYMRHIPLKPGTSVMLNIFNKKQFFKTEVHVVKKESLHTALGTVSTVLLRTNMDEAGDGVFYYPGDIYIWLTEDERRIPVLIEKRLKPLLEGKIPAVIKKTMPDFLLKKITGASVRAVIVRSKK